MKIPLRRRIVSVGLGEIHFGSGLLAATSFSLLRLHMEIDDTPIELGTPINPADVKYRPARTTGSSQEESPASRVGFP